MNSYEGSTVRHLRKFPLTQKDSCDTILAFSFADTTNIRRAAVSLQPAKLARLACAAVKSRSFASVGANSKIEFALDARGCHPVESKNHVPGTCDTTIARWCRCPGKPLRIEEIP